MKQNIQDTWDNVKKCKMYIIEYQKERIEEENFRSDNGQECSRIKDRLKAKIQEVQGTLSRINIKKLKCRHIILGVQKTKDEEKILKEGTYNRLSSETMEE